MWKIFWAIYLFLYFYTVLSQDYTKHNGDEMALLLATLGGILALCVCTHYWFDFKSWIDQIKKDKQSLESLQGEVTELQHEIFEMKLRLGWIRPHPDDEHTYIYIENNDLSNG